MDLQRFERNGIHRGRDGRGGAADAVFAGLVSASVTDRALRRRHAAALMMFVLAGLAGALATPAAFLAGFGIDIVIALTLAAFAGLGAAVLLAATGELELVLAGVFTLLALALGALALSLETPWPMLLLVAGPAEARLAGARTLFRLTLPTLFVAIGLGGYLSLHGIGPMFDGFAGWQVALPLLAAYGVGVLLRASRRIRADAGPAAARIAFVLDMQGRVLPGSGPRAGTGFARLSQRLHLLDRVAFLKAMDEIAQGGGGRDLELRLATGETAAGEFETLALRLRPVADAQGEVRRVEALERPARDEAPSEIGPVIAAARSPAMLATVSHELRTPLNAIIGFSDLLDQETFGPFADPRQKEYVALIRRSSRHLLDVVNGLLDVSKLEAGRYELQPERFAVCEIAEAAVEMVRGEADAKAIRIVVRDVPALASLVADRRACQQILVNLLANAVKFTPAGTVCLAVRNEDGAVLFEVADTGIGISPADIERLGQPFVQVSQGLSKRYEGSGLGLSVVKGLAELHHGSLRIRSQAGRGTTVTVRIPVDCAERLRSGSARPENVVAMTHAREKDAALPQDPQSRRTA